LWHEARQASFRRLPQLLRWRLSSRGATPQLVLRLPPPALRPEARARAEAGHAQGRLWLAGRNVAPTDWHRLALPRLVRYHLHYLDVARDWLEAWAMGASPKLRDDALALVMQWREQNPVAGTEGWEPYPVSVRLHHLTWMAARLGDAAPNWLTPLIALHARYVAAFPERHLQGNHLMKNWIALASAGLVLQGGEATRWAALGLQALEVELERQLLPDGGHEERSLMYHLLLLSDLLDVRDLAHAGGRSLPVLEAVLPRMGAFVAGTLHPDGDIPLFNDAVLGQAPSPAEVFARLGGVPSAEGRIYDAPQSGLFVLRPSREEALILDAGPLGPEHQPGHAHSDTLSYELSVAGQRRVVNGGMDGYQSPHRAFYRSAVAHNTVTVNGEGPDELWGNFRVGGRSRILARRAWDCVDFLCVRAAMEAFQGWRQERTVLLFPRRALVVLDRVVGSQPMLAVSRARLVPGMTPLHFVPLRGTASERSTAYAPEFGRTFEAREHAVQAQGHSLELGYAWVWGTQHVRRVGEGDGLEVEVDGQRFRAPAGGWPPTGGF
jgi:uncharacterized heparinase superfamily protein